MAAIRRLAPIALLFAAATFVAPVAAQSPTQTETQTQTQAQTQTQTDAEKIVIELNRVEPGENACQLVFVSQNDTATGLDQLMLEVVLFDRSGGVAALTLLDFQDLPAGRMRVRSFDMPGLQCDGLGRLLVNATAACAPQGAAGCDALALSSRVDEIEVLQ